MFRNLVEEHVNGKEMGRGLNHAITGISFESFSIETKIDRGWKIFVKGIIYTTLFNLKKIS